MTLTQTRNFVLKQMALQSLKRDLKARSYVRRYGRSHRRNISWLSGEFDPDYWANITLVRREDGSIITFS